MDAGAVLLGAVLVAYLASGELPEPGHRFPLRALQTDNISYAPSAHYKNSNVFWLLT